MADKEKASDRALGRDPFADMESPAWEETGAEREGAVAFDRGGAPPPPDQEWHLLDELIAQVDQEIEEAFGPGALADLSAGEGAEQVPLPARTGEEEQHILFRLGETAYAVPVTNVLEIGRPLDITPVPNVPDWVLGVANLRGDIISMVDLRAFLGLDPIRDSQTGRMMVAHAQGREMSAGLLVDWVSGIRQLPTQEITAPSAPVEGLVASFLRGVCRTDGRLLLVLDLERLLLSPELRQFEPV